MSDFNLYRVVGPIGTDRRGWFSAGVVATDKLRAKQIAEQATTAGWNAAFGAPVDVIRAKSATMIQRDRLSPAGQRLLDAERLSWLELAMANWPE